MLLSKVLLTFYIPAGGLCPPAGCPKIVLDHVHVYLYNIYIYWCAP